MVMMVMVQFLRDASAAQLLFRLNGRVDACVEFGFRVNEEGTACDGTQLTNARTLVQGTGKGEGGRRF